MTSILCSLRVVLIARSTVLSMLMLFGLAVSNAVAQNAPGITEDEIKIGGVFALSGPASLVTADYKSTIEAYFNSVNDAGGIHGRKIVWTVEDDGYQPARTLAGAKKLVERDNVFLVFGQVGAPTTAAAAPYLERKKVPFFTLNASPGPEFDYTFGVMADYGDVMYAVTKYLTSDLGKTKIAYFYQSDELGEQGRRGVLKAMEEASLELVADVGVARGSKDFSTQVLKLRESGAEAIVSMATGASTATAKKQAENIGFTPTWATFSVGGLNITKQLLGSDINGLIFGSEVDFVSTDIDASKKLRSLLEKYAPNVTYDWGAAIGYAHAQLIVDVLEKIGPNPTREAVLEELEKSNGYEVGLMDTLTYSSSKHTGSSAIRVYRWRNDVAQPVTDWLNISE